jgi:hypothetical protein
MLDSDHQTVLDSDHPVYWVANLNHQSLVMSRSQESFPVYKNNEVVEVLLSEAVDVLLSEAVEVLLSETVEVLLSETLELPKIDSFPP